MKLLKNGVCVYENKDAYVDALEDYMIEQYGLEVWESAADMIENQIRQFETAGELFNAYPELMDAWADDKVYEFNGKVFIYKEDMHETDSKEAVEFWLDMLNAIEPEADFEIVLD